MKISGIYKITNKVTGDFYIGSSKNIKQRWTNHRKPSAWKQNRCPKLYEAFIKYGLENFTFEVIEETDDIKEREQYWIEQLRPTYNHNWALGQDTERYKKYQKEYFQTDKGKKTRRKSVSKYYSQLCSYNGETLTLGTLRQRFYRAGIDHPIREAKMYLIENN